MCFIHGFGAFLPAVFIVLIYRNTVTAKRMHLSFYFPPIYLRLHPLYHCPCLSSPP